MSGKRLLVAAIWLGLIAIAAVGVKFFVLPMFKQQQLEATSSTGLYEHEIAFGIDGFSGYGSLRSDEFSEGMRRHKTRVNFIDDGADYEARIKGLRDGKLDMAVFTLDSLIKSSIAIGDMPATVILVIGETKGADAIVAHQDRVPNVSALNDPKARIIATGNSPSEMLSRTLRASFQLEDMGRNWLEAVDGPDEVMKRLKAGNSDPRAYALWEPYVSQAQELPGVNVIFSTASVQGYVVDVIVARRGFLTNNYDLAKAVIEEYLTASYQHRSGDMVKLVMEDAKALGEPLRRPQAEAIVNGIQWRNTLENFAYFGLLMRHESGGLPHIEDAIMNINDVLIDTGAVSDNNRVVGNENLLYFDQIVIDLQQEKFHPNKTNSQSAGTLGSALADYSNQLEAVQTSVQLQPLSDSEWDNLMAVGQIQAEPIKFGRNSTRLFPQGKRDIQSLADKLRSFPAYYLQVVGHVSFTPSPDMSEQEVQEIRQASIDLAQRRADAVAEFLYSTGFDRNRVRAVAAAPTRGSEGSVSFLVGQKSY